jgi:hypothetical protein
VFPFQGFSSAVTPNYDVVINLSLNWILNTKLTELPKNPTHNVEKGFNGTGTSEFRSFVVGRSCTVDTALGV